MQPATKPHKVPPLGQLLSVEISLVLASFCLLLARKYVRWSDYMLSGNKRQVSNKAKQTRYSRKSGTTHTQR